MNDWKTTLAKDFSSSLALEAFFNWPMAELGSLMTSFQSLRKLLLLLLLMSVVAVAVFFSWRC